MPSRLRVFATRFFIVASLVLPLSAGAAFAQTSTFTYQGRLTDSGTPPVSAFYDMQFTLYDGSGSLQGSPSTITFNNPGVQVTNGIFTVQLDFGASAFPGAARLLEIAVRPHNSDPNTPAYTTLSPRQPITSTPYAIQALNATTATTATNATNATNAAQLGGVAAANYLQTNGNGSGLTNLNPANISSGTANINISGTAAFATSGGSSAANFVFSYDTTIQPVFVAGTFQDITFNTNPQINGWTHAAGTGSFTCNQTGTYLIEYAAKVSSTLFPTSNATLIGSLNGTEVPGSQTSTDLTGANLTFAISKSFLASITSGQILTLQVTSGNPGLQLQAIRGFGTTKPSVSLTIVRIQ